MSEVTAAEHQHIFRQKWFPIVGSGLFVMACTDCDVVQVPFMPLLSSELQYLQGADMEGMESEAVKHTDLNMELLCLQAAVRLIEACLLRGAFLTFDERRTFDGLKTQIRKMEAI